MMLGSTPAIPAKRISRGSPQQEAFWAELCGGTGNVLLEARAGTGKSSSCREGMWRVLDARPDTRISYCCFNKAIADEFRQDCPPGVTVGTMHSLGLSAIGRGERPRIERNKTYLLLDNYVEGKKLGRPERRSVATLVGHAKNHAVMPGDPEIPRQMARLAARFDVDTHGQLATIASLAARVLADSAEILGVVDFDDMLWMPVARNMEVPHSDMLMIDEVQDLNPIQHALASRLGGSGRIVIVGDPFQAIYGWRGAAIDSVATLRDQLQCKTLPLTVSWRCPESHARHARQWVPDFRAAPNAPEGVIRRGDLAYLQAAMPGDMVLCRLNAPLIHTCLDMIGRHVPARMRGRAIGDNLANVARLVAKRCVTDSDMATFLVSLATWRDRLVTQYMAQEGMEDKIEETQDKYGALAAIASSVDSVPDIMRAIADLFADDNPATHITFSSIHRAKGSEANRVYWMDVEHDSSRDDRNPPSAWQIQQRSNLQYVAATRSRDALTIMGM